MPFLGRQGLSGHGFVGRLGTSCVFSQTSKDLGSTGRPKSGNGNPADVDLEFIDVAEATPASSLRFTMRVKVNEWGCGVCRKTIAAMIIGEPVKSATIEPFPYFIINQGINLGSTLGGSCLRSPRGEVAPVKPMWRPDPLKQTEHLGKPKVENQKQNKSAIAGVPETGKPFG